MREGSECRDFVWNWKVGITLTLLNFVLTMKKISTKNIKKQMRKESKKDPD
jgi:hypothetical protein